MQYGLIGKKLSHSFSADIHRALSGIEYVLREADEEEFAAFFEQKAFAAVNVTIPYKQAVMRYLDVIDPQALKIGAVNTVANRNGKLYGYNTDYLGLKALIEKHTANFHRQTVLILGSGGTSLTAEQVALSLGAAQVKRVSRSGKDGCIDYATAYADYAHAHCIINTTPVGMFPHPDAAAVDLARFEQLKYVFDAVYNPLRTDLVLQAEQRGIVAQGGLYMLVAQAVFASEYFLDTHYDSACVQRIFEQIVAQKRNTVLIGMPGSGKTTVGKLLAATLHRPFCDTDQCIEQREQCAIADIFRTKGEAYFRQAEAGQIREISARGEGIIIATGGGAILSEENVKNLKRNGRLYFLDRDIKELVPTADRPLARDTAAIKKRYLERYARYLASADVHIKVCGDAAAVAAQIGKDIESES